MQKCSSFCQHRKLVVIVVRGAFFIVEEVLFWYSKTSCSILHKKDASNDSQRCCAYQATKYGRLSMSVPL